MNTLNSAESESFEEREESQSEQTGGDAEQELNMGPAQLLVSSTQPAALARYDWSNKWLKGDEYAQMLVNIDAYCSAFGLLKYDRKTHPESIYKAPENGLIYFVEGNCVGSEFGFPRVPFRKQYRWKKMNFTTDLPKKRPKVTYIVASSVKCSKSLANKKGTSDIYRMHAVILYRDTDAAPITTTTKSYILCHIRRIDIAEAAQPQAAAATSIQSSALPIQNKSGLSTAMSPKIEDDDFEYSEDELDGSGGSSNKAQNKAQAKQIQHIQQQIQNQYLPLKQITYNQQAIVSKSSSPFEVEQKKKRKCQPAEDLKPSEFTSLLNHSSPRFSFPSSSGSNPLTATLKEEDPVLLPPHFSNNAHPLIQPQQFSPLQHQMALPPLHQLMQQTFPTSPLLPQPMFAPQQTPQQYALQMMMINLAQQQLEQERIRQQQQQQQELQEQNILNMIQLSQNNKGFSDFLCQLLQRENVPIKPETEIDYQNLFNLSQVGQIATASAAPQPLPNFLFPTLKKEAQL